MKDTQILSVFEDTKLLPTSTMEQAVVNVPSPLLDACRVGVVLRAVLFVQGVVALVAMFGSGSALDWLMRTSLFIGAALPATLLWLLVTCASKRFLLRWPALWQQAVGVLWGALAGLYGCAALEFMGLIEQPPWWSSAASGAALAAVMVTAMVWRARAATPAAVTARLAELQARIRPHFLFNTLNSAIALVRDEPRKAERLLEDLSDLFRVALAEQGSSVTLASEIALARRYLAIEQLRFGDRIQVEWAIDAQADAAMLPPLLLQPLVENAVKHGVEPQPQGARIRVSTQRRGSVVIIKVTNTVSPDNLGSVAGHGLALANVRERLALLHDVQGQFRCGLHDGVFQVRIEVPL